LLSLKTDFQLQMRLWMYDVGCTMYVSQISKRRFAIGPSYIVHLTQYIRYRTLAFLSKFDVQFTTMALHLTPDNRLKKLIVIGDRMLIKPSRPEDRTASGLYLPPGVQEREKVQQGYVIKTGPGYAIPMPVEDEPWKGDDEKIKYVPLQAKEGDLAIFLVSGATEVMYENEKYFIVPQSAILMLEREEEL